ncbi:hypothetical protein B0T10DRAFT_372279, partial [Thelonectria olida]
SSIMESPMKRRDRTNENFSRAMQRLMRRCNQVSRRYGADVYIQVRQNRRYSDFISTDDP